MIKKILIELVIIFSCIFYADAQKLMPQFEMGYGSFSMKGLSELNKNMLSHAPVSSNLLDDFPSGWYYRPSLMLKYEILNLGVVYTYQHTFSEIWGKNDTSTYQFNLDAISHCPGIYGELSIYYVGNWTLGADASLGFISSELKLNERCTSHDSVLFSNNVNYKALSYFIEPGIHLKYSYKHFDFGLNAGYFITIATEDYYTDDVYRYSLTDPYSNATFKPQWNGYRVGMSVSYFIYRKTVIKPTPKYRGRR